MAVQLKEKNSYAYKDKDNIENIIKEVPFTELAKEPHPGYYFMKRAMDIVLSLTAIIVLSPVFIITAILIKLTSPGSCIYSQIRVGKGGRYFTIYKFRSMYMDADERLAELKDRNEKDGPIFKIENDPRITPVGHFIRKFSIDELPQLFNILIGDMSIVGPRPALPNEVSEYSKEDSMRLLVQPGLTCIWQVSGRSNIGFEEWMEMDRQYIEKRSILFDIFLIFKTIPAVLKGEGAC